MKEKNRKQLIDISKAVFISSAKEFHKCLYR